MFHCHMPGTFFNLKVGSQAKSRKRSQGDRISSPTRIRVGYRSLIKASKPPKGFSPSTISRECVLAPYTLKWVIFVGFILNRDRGLRPWAAHTIIRNLWELLLRIPLTRTLSCHATYAFGWCFCKKNALRSILICFSFVIIICLI